MILFTLPKLKNNSNNIKSRKSFSKNHAFSRRPVASSVPLAPQNPPNAQKSRQGMTLTGFHLIHLVQIEPTGAVSIGERFIPCSTAIRS
jgi:hypothetical protein